MCPKQGQRPRAAGKLAEWPAVVVHGRPMAELAVHLAADRGLLLLSAPGAAATLGAPWFLAITAGLADARNCAAALDCADAPGFVMPAVRAGLRYLILDGSCPAFGVLAAAAAEYGAVLLPVRPPALDLAWLDLSREGGRRKLSNWLAGGR